MDKQAWMEKHGVICRKANAADRKAARTDDQRAAEYIISIPALGVEWYSKRGTLEDMRKMVEYTLTGGPGSRRYHVVSPDGIRLSDGILTNYEAAVLKNEGYILTEA